MMGRDSVSSEQQLEDQQWVVESRRLKNPNQTNSSCNCAFARFASQKSLGRLEQAGARRARSNVSRILNFLVDLC